MIEANVEERPLNRDAIKYIAMFTMLLNHIANIFLETGTWLCELFLAVGYFTAIAMIYFLVEGYDYTRSRKKYILRLLIFGIISQIPYCMAFAEEGIIEPYNLNMMFTLALCFGLIWVFDVCQNNFVKVVAAIGAILLSTLCSWAILAPVYTLLFIWARHSERKTKIAFLVATLLFGAMNFLGGRSHFPASQNIAFTLLGMAGTGLAALCILYLYNGKRADKWRTFSKWFFYAFYPAHLLILGLIRIAIA
ncbi:MAG: TraX family protein [Peptoniphilus sp.]|nr:TraX family protein [Peptoniphilus sp.]MDD7362836.1 TraX family protein [Bacillota bacterium]MDY6043972.1 TraX family protein [Peptoniphilus sp.]